MNSRFSTSFVSLLLVSSLLHIHKASCRKHQLIVEEDTRRYFPLSTFGFLTGGKLEVNVSSLVVPRTDITLGFTLDRTQSDAMNPYLDGRVSRCTLNSTIVPLDTHSSIMYFTFRLDQMFVEVSCSDSVASVMLTRAGLDSRSKRSLVGVTGQQLCSKFDKIPLHSGIVGGVRTFNTSFVVEIPDEDGEGLYSLTFHSCANYGVKNVAVNMSVSMVESNMDSYLSAGEMKLPAVYFIMALLFLVSTLVWICILRRSARENVYRTHWVMALLGLMKSLSLGFHGVNYRVIETNGYHSETWAVLFYITHLMKGALLFVTILLLGTGWTFIKHVLSDREKKMFMIVIPLQLLANVAQIILEESEEGDTVHTTWRQVLYLVDIICCAAILFPVVWSIRHLQEASKTDGKAVMNLKKLQLFRHFYVMIVCYIYFTRIVVYLLQIMVPFRYEWVDEVFREAVTFIFFMSTSVKFQPADNNPYFQVPLSDDEPEVNEILTETGLTENVRRVRSRRDADGRSSSRQQQQPSQELQQLMQSEDSHELD